MTLLKHELRQGKTAFLIWTASVSFLLAVCIFLFPEMKGEMDPVSDIFASMGIFSDAFGLDRLNFGTLTGFYAVECGNVLGLGGAFFAAFIGVTALAKEEKDRTAEFLLSHPISRARAVTEKLVAIAVQIVAMNAIILGISLLSIRIIGETIPWREVLLIHLTYFFLQIELSCLCFGISAFLRRGGIGIGLGLAVILYFLNLVANMTEKAEVLKYVTPFAYCEGADIVGNGKPDMLLIGIGAALSVLGILTAYLQYGRKDIR